MRFDAIPEEQKINKILATVDRLEQKIDAYIDQGKFAQSTIKRDLSKRDLRIKEMATKINVMKEYMEQDKKPHSQKILASLFPEVRFADHEKDRR